MELIETKEKFIQMRAQGYSYEKISKELGKAKQTLMDWNKELKDEIASRKTLELNTLYESYYLLKENRLQTLGAMLTKIKAEVDRRELSDIPTDKLLEIFLKYNSQVREETVETQGEDIPAYAPPQITVHISQEAIDKVNNY